MVYRDRSDADEKGTFREKRGRIILAGGEILLDPVRESVLYPALDQLQRKYRTQGGAELIVQTTGDILSEKLIVELLEQGVSSISVSGMDEYHDGLKKEEARDRLREKLSRLFLKHGMEEWTPAPRRPDGVIFISSGRLRRPGLAGYGRAAAPGKMNFQLRPWRTIFATAGREG